MHLIDARSPGPLAIAPWPRGGEKLLTDLAAWRAAGIRHVVSLLQEDEAAEHGLADEAAACARAGLTFRSHPVPDFGVPASAAAFRALEDEILGRLARGGGVLAHCRGGIGRSGTLACALLMRRGFAAATAREIVSTARGLEVPETDEQRAWLEREHPLLPGGLALREGGWPGDIGAVSAFHARTYAREHGFDATFEAYVASAAAGHVLKGSPRERTWLAEREAIVVGSIAIVEDSPEVAKLRWFLVDPSARGAGLGGRLVEEAIRFSREQGYRSILLWTERRLAAAARLYERSGFRLVEERRGRQWGCEVVEERWELGLGAG